MIKPLIAITHRDSQSQLTKETEVLLRELKSRGYSCCLFDWRNIKGRIKEVDIIIHRNIGSVRENYNDSFIQYKERIAKMNQYKFINSLDNYFKGITKDYLIELQNDGFPVTPSIKINSSMDFGRLQKVSKVFNTEYIVIKPIDGELGQDINLISNISRAQYEDMASRTSSFLIQPFIKEIFEGERSVAVLIINKEIKVFHGIKRIPENWIADSSSCKQIKQIKPTGLEKKLVVQIFKSSYFDFIEYGFYRIDFIGTTKKYISEVEIINPQVGLEYLHRASLKEYMEGYIKLIKNVAKRA